MHRQSTRGMIIALALALVAPTAASAAPNNNNSAKLTSAVTVAGIREHLNALQAISDANGDNRFAGFPGHDASAQYVYDRARAAGYDVRFQEFEYDAAEDLSVLTKLSPPPARSYLRFLDFLGAFTGGRGDVTAPLAAVDLDIPADGGSTSGCEPGDFAGFAPGSIALLQRGTCNFTVKVANAEAAGAAGAVIFNEGNAPDRVGLVNPNVTGATIPVVGATFAAGDELRNGVTNGPTATTVRVKVDFFIDTLTTRNVIAESERGSSDNVVVVGAHLDSVIDAPGINDNGSGSATILEIAEQMTKVKPRNQVRFVWFSAEESGLLGAQHYVTTLPPGEQERIALMLNFDMVGSPNFARFVYDGSNPAAPAGSGAIEDTFNGWFAERGLAFEPTPFDGRSDYGPFIAAGIPAGGLFTGAEQFKSIAQVGLYGGTAGVAFDPCYHSPCDDVDNVNDTALDQMSDAAAHAVITYAQNTVTVNGVRGKGNFKPRPRHDAGPPALG